MSFTLLSSTLPIVYELCQPGDGAVYNPYLCLPPRIYREETVDSLVTFFYSEALDRYIIIVMMRFAVWPSWRINHYEVDPGTGVGELTPVTTGAIATAWTKNQINGDLNKVYGRYFFSIVEVTLPEAVPTATQVANPILTSADVGGIATGAFLLNRQDQILAIASSGKLLRWNYGTQQELQTIPMTGFVNTLAYESNELAWVGYPGPSGIGTYVTKVNWKTPQVQAFAFLQPDDGSADTRAYIAYDSLRQNIAVLRMKTNATDGAALHKLDIYKTIPGPVTLTDPVPTEKIVIGQTTTLTANLIGAAGESIVGNEVTLSNTGNGTFENTKTSSVGSGIVPVAYRPGDIPGTDTITLQTGS